MIRCLHNRVPGPIIGTYLFCWFCLLDHRISSLAESSTFLAIGDQDWLATGLVHGVFTMHTSRAGTDMKILTYLQHLIFGLDGHPMSGACIPIDMYSTFQRNDVSLFVLRALSRHI